MFKAPQRRRYCRPGLAGRSPVLITAVVLAIPTAALAVPQADSPPGAGRAAATPALPQATATQAQQAPTPAADFRFGAPLATLGGRISWIFAGEGSDVYTFNQENLTISEGAFNAPAIGGDVGIALSPKLDLVFSVEYSAVKIDSQTRAPAPDGAGPVEQTTQLKQIPVTAGFKYYITDRGHIQDPYFWVPESVAVYVGGGGGMSWWRYQQAGDFVDTESDTVFGANFLADGWDLTFYFLGGADIAINPDWGLNLEFRYMLASGDLEPEFVGFEPIDLGGIRLAAGANVRF